MTGPEYERRLEARCDQLETVIRCLLAGQEGAQFDHARQALADRTWLTGARS